MVSFADSWKVMPIVVLLLLAGLESIPLELYEAASMDGGGKWHKMRYITLPLLKSTITMTVLLRMVDLLRIFELPATLLGRVTPYLGTLAYDEYKYLNYNSSAAVSTTLLVLIIILAFIYMTVFERETKKGGAS
jgi:trehalose transport system permease protein